MISLGKQVKTIKILKDHPPLSPVLTLVKTNNRLMVLKDYTNRSLWVKAVWGGLLINNECRALRHLTELKGVPQLIQKIGDYGLLLEYIKSEPLAHFKVGELAFDTYLKLVALVKQIHARGIIHLDIGQRRNILIDKAGNPYVIDFANALYIRRNVTCFNPVFKLLSRIDYRGLLKLKNRWFPGSLTRQERSFLKRNYFLRKLWVFKPHKYRAKDMVK